jgi:hypothetical protein
MFVVLDGDEEVLFATAVAIAASKCGVASGAMLQTAIALGRSPALWRRLRLVIGDKNKRR